MKHSRPNSAPQALAGSRAFLSIVVFLTSICIAASAQSQDLANQHSPNQELKYGPNGNDPYALPHPKDVTASNFLLNGEHFEHGPPILGQNLDETSHSSSIKLFSDLLGALETLQNRFFELWLGTWPTCIDWTGAVMSTFVSSSLHSVSKSSKYFLAPEPRDDVGLPPLASSLPPQFIENLVNQYFSQVTTYYFGEDAFALRQQAHDDMLWVVLGWLESIKLVNLHTKLHHKNIRSMASASASASDGVLDQVLKGTTNNTTWFGEQFKAGHAHRAHVFYDIVSRAWDTSLCHGGLTWNPRLKPYKNTITNTLYISASIGMYLHHPGDSNTSPFHTKDLPRLEPHDSSLLANAVAAYDWLKSVNLTNAQGLFVDGYHIKNWGVNGTNGTGECDERSEMVYTYNQGVLLSGLRGLWEGTGQIKYLQDGHSLVRNVLHATGFRSSDEPVMEEWSGLGRAGILTEFCDPSGSCSQDAQTFKGIFFHHLTLFCESLPTTEPLILGKSFTATPAEALFHARSCREYLAWVGLNAHAALETRDQRGVFGMWWNANLGDAGSTLPLPQGAEDIRNTGTPNSTLWRYSKSMSENPDLTNEIHHNEITNDKLADDLNDRGRGRTVETQGGGLMVLRAYWELLLHPDRDQA